MRFGTVFVPTIKCDALVPGTCVVSTKFKFYILRFFIISVDDSCTFILLTDFSRVVGRT